MAKADAVIRAASTTRWDAGKLTVANGWNWPTAAGHTHSASDRFRFETERRRSAAGWQGCSRRPGTVAGGHSSSSNLKLLGDLQCIIDLDAEVSHRGCDVRVAEQ